MRERVGLLLKAPRGDAHVELVEATAVAGTSTPGQPARLPVPSRQVRPPGRRRDRRRREAPVHDLRLAVRADEDVLRLQIAVDHASVVRGRDRLRRREHVTDQGASRLGGHPLGHGARQRTAADKPHRVERPAVGEVPAVVDRDDAWVIEAAGDRCLPGQAGRGGRVAG